MSGKLWNKNIDNVFGLLRSGMSLNGTWPLLRSSSFANIRWAFGLFLLIMVQISLSIEITKNRTGTNGVAESVMIWVYVIIFEVKYFYLYVHAKPLAKNVNSAIEDWWNAERNEEWRMVMKRYSQSQKKFNVYMIFMSAGTSIVYWTVIYLRVLYYNLKNDESVNDNDNGTPIPKHREYVIPSSWLDERIGSVGYILLNVLYMMWNSAIVLTEWLSSSLYYTVVMHLAGQFEILGNEFCKFGSGVKTGSTLRRKLGILVRRQNHLLMLAENLRASFAEIIFVQLGLCATIVAVMGFRTIVTLKQSNYMELLKSILNIGFLLAEIGIYIYTADFLSVQGENIFYIVNQIPWYEFPRNVAKDLVFVMVRSEKPVRLSGGKFFYVSRSTLMYIINTAVSYISVLNATVQS